MAHAPCWFLALGLGGLLAPLWATLSGCGSPLVVNANPAVRFTEPQGAVMYIKVGGGTLRAVFDGRVRGAPVMCSENLAQLDTSQTGPSLRHTLVGLARGRGSAPVQLHAPDGTLLGRGHACIFPLLRTSDLEVQKSYVIQVPLGIFRQTKRGLPAVVYQAYSPEGADGPRWKHVAWVIWWAPDL